MTVHKPWDLQEFDVNEAHVSNGHFGQYDGICAQAIYVFGECPTEAERDMTVAGIQFRLVEAAKEQGYMPYGIWRVVEDHGIGQQHAIGVAIQLRGIN